MRDVKREFVKEMKRYRHVLPRQTLKTIRGQALRGDLVGAAKGLRTAFGKTNVMSMTHRQTQIMVKHQGAEYRGQFICSLRESHKILEKVKEWKV